MRFLSLSLLAVAAAVLWKRIATIDLYTPEKDSLIGKTVLITGATTGLGLESAKRLATAGANLILTARSDDKGRAAVDSVTAYLQEKNLTYVNQSISYRLLELDKLSSVKQTVEWLDDLPTIDVLMNNAGVMALPDRELTVDGLERQMQTNHLGHFVLTSILKEKFAKDCRIITVSSSAHKIARISGGLFSGGLDFDYMWKADIGYSPWKSYGQSKLANIYFTQALQKRIDAAGLQWTAVAVHPGAVATDLQRYLSKHEFLQKIAESIFHAGVKIGIVRTVEHGATTQIWLAAVTDKAAVVGSAYYADSKVEPLGPFATNETSAERLWKESEKLSGVTFTL